VADLIRRRQRRKTLTNRMIATLPRKRRRYTVTDPEQRGMYVRVPPQGPCVFAAVARDPYGKQVWATLGSADVMTIEQAREEARARIKRIRAGLPAIESPPTKPDSFEAVAAGWLRRHVEAKGLRTRYEIERVLTKYVYPHWREREFAGLRRSDVARLLDHVEDHHGSRQADVVLSVVRAIGNWHASRNDDYLSPFTRGMRRVDPKAGTRARVLDDEELRKVWHAAEETGAFGALVRTLLLTGQRLGKVVSMRWVDISPDGVWTIRTESAREKGTAGSLKLPKLALDIIRAQPRFTSNEHVFAGRGAGHINDIAADKAALDRASGVSDWVLHDLRRCARSFMSRADVRPDIAERVLGHAIKGVEGVYDRHRYDDAKADALQRLAALIERIVHPPEGDVVVPLRAPAMQP
jgi:integrase